MLTLDLLSLSALVDELRDALWFEPHRAADLDAGQRVPLGKFVHERHRAPEHLGDFFRTQEVNFMLCHGQFLDGALMATLSGNLNAALNARLTEALIGALMVCSLGNILGDPLGGSLEAPLEGTLGNFQSSTRRSFAITCSSVSFSKSRCPQCRQCV